MKRDDMAASDHPEEGIQTVAISDSARAVYEEDVVRHYQEFLDRRRARRPEGEYRQPTPEEWDDFTGHFDKRKVELGSCGRPYGTPCQHEHGHQMPDALGQSQDAPPAR